MKKIMTLAAALLCGVFLRAQDPDFHIFLCLGQSNMEGAARPEHRDSIDIPDNYLMMPAVDYVRSGRRMGEWTRPLPPLCREMSGLTPADYFARTLAVNLPEGHKVGIINVAVGGTRIEGFMNEKVDEYLVSQAPWFKNIMAIYGNRPYDRLVETARLAQKDGVISGILMHQGESNTGDPEWCGKVKEVYGRLLGDLGLEAVNVPLLVGEVVNKDVGGVAAGANEMIDTLARVIPTAHVISSKGLPCGPDHLHFSAQGYRRLGYRYALEMMKIMGITPKPLRSLAPDQKPASTNVPKAGYPNVDSEGRASFILSAPQASSVLVDICGKKYPMLQDMDGIWKVTTDPLVPGFHYYFLEVDGARFSDPNSHAFYGCGVDASGIEIPEDGEKAACYSFNPDIPHGQVRECRYWSETEGRMRRCFVYTPASYESGKGKYPVLYLQHGMAENERSWSHQGRMADILDGQIAAGKCVPMIVVMDNGNCDYGFNFGGGESRDEFGASFRGVLLNDIIPYIEKTFRVKADSRHRALAGLSWGGRQAFDIGFAHPDRFSYLGSFSGAIFLMPGTDIRKQWNGIFADPKAFSQKVKLLFMGTGTEEDLGTAGMHRMLEEAGVDHVYYESEGTAHEWLSWRRCLGEFIPLIFK